MLEVFDREDLSGRRSIAGAANHSGRLEEFEFESQALIECNNPIGGLVREHDGTWVPGKPLGRSYLVFPTEALFGVAREFDIVWRIRVNEIVWLKCDRFKIRVHKIPIRTALTIGSEVSRVRDAGVPTEGHVETAFAIDPAETVVASPIEVIEKRCRFLACIFSIDKELIEALA